MQLSLSGIVPVPLREKTMSRVSALWNQQISFRAGEYIFVQAPSGTGKTTLIHLLYGLRTDYEGTVKWGENILRSATAIQLADMRKGSVSVIFQDLRLFPDLTAWENLEIKRALTNTITVQEVETWMLQLGIQDKKNALAATLSYGERQRVAIIRALLQPFSWLLMDEPFSHLDKANIEKAISLIGEVAARNKAGILLADLDENHYFPYTQTILL
ncbi:ATP-binding cassette domain-containing protein [Chitinophagaceae bacterium MMS25-I14]